MRVKKYVLDANIWVSYFISQHHFKIANIILENDLLIYYCEDLIVEIKRVLSYQHLKKYKIDIPKAIYFIKNIAIAHDLQKPIKKYIKEDAADNYVIALALQTNSGFVTSGDRHILDNKIALEKTYTKLKILRKIEFEKKFEK
jgi:uncharacterized protein